ncbi:MAG: hypothetical protein JKY37_15470 [Nannocystaceae bacterium]|nr:hypothetical protein [Nannocystaceae bacterium]
MNADLASRIAALHGPEHRFEFSQPRPFCVVIEPSVATERDFLHEDFLAGARRQAFFSLVDDIGLVVIRGVHADRSRYRDVRGRSSRGRLSQGEYFHHDGCSGPTKPRIVEIRCPHQNVPRMIATAVAPFPETVHAMLRALPARVGEDTELRCFAEQLEREGGLPHSQLDHVQGRVTRAIRRGLSAADARAYFREVDRRCDAYDAPWQRGESRFIANANAKHTMQHRRAYGMSHDELGPTGRLLKRWPADPGVLA